MDSLEINYYDKILGGIAASLVGGALLGYFTGIPISHSFGIGAAVSILLIYDGMFRNGPLG